jgi:hypothetical protein
MSEDVIKAFNQITRDGIKPNYSRMHWQVLFNYYNASHEKKLSMGCTPCFFKVYNYLKQELTQSMP